jgi:hypothetical protein
MQIVYELAPILGATSTLQYGRPKNGESVLNPFWDSILERKISPNGDLPKVGQDGS